MLNILRLLSNITTEDRNAFYCTNKLIFGKYDRLIAVSTICWFALITKVEFLFLIRFYHCNFNIFQSTLITFTNHINRWYILHCISNKDCISVYNNSTKDVFSKNSTPKSDVQLDHKTYLVTRGLKNVFYTCISALLIQISICVVTYYKQPFYN